LLAVVQTALGYLEQAINERRQGRAFCEHEKPTQH
jgi:hypothetical protein